MSRERLRYWFDNTMSKGTPALIGWLAVASALLIAFVTVLAYPFSGEHGSALKIAWMSLLRTLDPGTMGGDDGNEFFVFMMLFVTIGGLFIVSALVGVLTTGLEAKLDGLRKGRSRVVEEGHTVLLGWSDDIFAIISELVTAKESEKRSVIAVLADRDKVEMEEDLRARLGDTGRTRIVCRTGDPSERSALDSVSPGAASSILVLPADDSQLIKTLLALGNRQWPATRPPVVAAVTDSGNLGAARIAGGEHVEVVDSEEIAARLVVQSCRQSGLSAVYSDLLDFDGDEIYIRSEPSLAGRTYGDALLAYATAAPLGLRRQDGTVEINPPSSTLIRPGDQVILIAADDSEIRLATSAPAIRHDAIREPGVAKVSPSRTLILGSNIRRARILRELGHYLPAGSEIHLAGPESDEAAPAPGVLVTSKECDTTSRTALESLGVRTYDHVIVLSDDAYEAQKADARTLVTLLHLRDMKAGSAIVSEMNDERNRLLAQVAEADDFVVGGKLVSLLLTQLAENRHLAQVFDQLFSHLGSEIYLKPAGDYVATGVPVNFVTVIEAARSRGETAIGYRRAGDSGTPPRYGVRLNPGKEAPLTLEPGDRVIVLSES
ncbi:CASTOR/POLLUX-related putative ion channel [Sphaerisporangium corydalis]|uniref:Potassium transporter TrkA n=1 Tax=Sphaerisporangium corydalis TaxID=1441875 RepID=A0ABV9ETA0_9ACTN|nr:potassium transporter TrkA [Sphaerisporangium corydalis]